MMVSTALIVVVSCIYVIGSTAARRYDITVRTLEDGNPYWKPELMTIELIGLIGTSGIHTFYDLENSYHGPARTHMYSMELNETVGPVHSLKITLQGPKLYQWRAESVSVFDERSLDLLVCTVSNGLYLPVRDGKISADFNCKHTHSYYPDSIGLPGANTNCHSLGNPVIELPSLRSSEFSDIDVSCSTPYIKPCVFHYKNMDAHCEDYNEIEYLHQIEIIQYNMTSSLTVNGEDIPVKTDLVAQSVLFRPVKILKDVKFVAYANKLYASYKEFDGYIRIFFCCRRKDDLHY